MATPDAEEGRVLFRVNNEVLTEVSRTRVETRENLDDNLMSFYCKLLESTYLSQNVPVLPSNRLVVFRDTLFFKLRRHNPIIYEHICTICDGTH